MSHEWNETIALLNKHADNAIEYLRENGREVDDDDRAVIWNEMSALLSEAARQRKERRR